MSVVESDDSVKIIFRSERQPDGSYRTVMYLSDLLEQLADDSKTCGYKHWQQSPVYRGVCVEATLDDHISLPSNSMMEQVVKKDVVNQEKMVKKERGWMIEESLDRVLAAFSRWRLHDDRMAIKRWVEANFVVMER